MSKCSVLLVLVLASSVANAGGLLDTIRTVREVADTAKEVNQARKDVQQMTGTQANGQTSAAPAQASSSAGFQMGDVLVTKLKSVKIYADADKKSKKVAQLPKATEVVFAGQEMNGFIKVNSDKGEGWVEALMVKKQ